MRCAALVLAALLVAVSASAQPPVPATKADPKLDAHLSAWETKMAGVSNFHTKIALTRTELTFKKKVEFTGSVLCMKPAFARLRIESATNAADYEAYQSDGKSLYVFDGPSKTVTRVKLEQGQAANTLMLDFLGGMKAKDVKTRFEIKLFQEDANYVYLDLKPIQPADQREFKQMRMALYKDAPATAKWAYLPAQVFLLKPSGDTEEWKFSETQLDVPKVGEDSFKFQGAPKGFEFREAPADANGLVPLPVGGGVRPNK